MSALETIKQNGSILEDLIKPVKVFKGPWTSSDESITTPTEVHLYADGSAIACHPDQGDFPYETLFLLQRAYLITIPEAL
jgi:hypothetical protein